MSHSIHGADRATHLRIVIVALFAAVTVSTLSLCLHLHAKPATTEASAALKAGRPVLLGSAILAPSR